MHDLAALKPHDNTPIEIAAAINRYLTVGRTVMAEIERLKAAQAGLLASGHQIQIDQNIADLAQANAQAMQISSILQELTRKLDKAAAEQQGVLAEHKAALAVTEMANWVAQNSETLVIGAQLLAGLVRSLALQLQPAGAQPKPSNVVPMAPTPTGRA